VIAVYLPAIKYKRYLTYSMLFMKGWGQGRRKKAIFTTSTKL
jgi:hypothetical protein